LASIYPMTVQIINDVEIGDIPPTPTSMNEIPQVIEAEVSLINRGFEFGYVYSYRQEQGGSEVQHVFPIKKEEGDQISSSSKVELELHTETAFHPYKPDYVMLLCLRGDENAATTFVCLEDLVGDTDPEIIFELTKEDFVTSIDKSFRMNGEEDKLIKTSIIQRSDDGYLKLNYDSSVMYGITTNAQMALDEFKKVISKHVREFTLKPGQLAIIDNTATIHGRKDFKARYDGTDRWLLRCMVLKNLVPEDHREDRVITTTF
jgi:L-asparagine oxygenase